MELFKTVVKKAVEVNAYRVRIYEGDQIEFFLGNNETVSTSVSVDANTTDQIFKLYGEKAALNELQHMQWEVFTGPSSSFHVYYQKESNKIDLFFGETAAEEITKIKKNELQPTPAPEINLSQEEIPSLDSPAIEIASTPIEKPQSIPLDVTKDIPLDSSDAPAPQLPEDLVTENKDLVTENIEASIPIVEAQPQPPVEIKSEVNEDTEIEVDFGNLTEDDDAEESSTEETVDELPALSVEAKEEAPLEAISEEAEEEVSFDLDTVNMFDTGEADDAQEELSESPEVESETEEVEEIAIDFSSPAKEESKLKILETPKKDNSGSTPMDDSISIHNSIEDEKKQKTVTNKKSTDGVEHIEIRWTNEEKGSKPISDGTNALDPLLKVMLDKGASDIHLTMGEIPCFRIDGDIVRYNEHPAMTPAIVEKYFYPIMPQSNRIEFARDSDTDFAYEVKGLARFRVNIFRDRTGVGAVMRQIPSEVFTAEQLGLTDNITQFAHIHKGLVVVTGPTGSGKSTTLAAVVDLVNKTRSDHILTVEDPVEFVHRNQNCLVNHREVGKHTKSFSRALKAALREDPDIVLIGEMRDLETVAIAIETAETGHLVFGTLHTNTAISTVDRIIDQFPAEQQQQIRMMLSNSLMGVIAQTLLKKKGGGRCAAHEVLVVNDAVRSMIREGKTHMLGNHMQTKKKEGNILLNDSLLKLVLDDVVDADHALGKSINRNDLIQKYEQKGVRYTKEDNAA